MDELSCDPFCLSSQTTCTCTLTGEVLVWRLNNVNGGSVGLESLNSGDLNMPKPLLGAPAFQTLLTYSTSGTLTATLSFTTLSDYEVYTIECGTGASIVTVTISIQGINW